MTLLDNEILVPPSAPGDVFWAVAYRAPPRPCVWCGAQCWDAWQECHHHSRQHPWRGRDWQRMVARLEMHKRWDAQYLRRHPEHRGAITSQILELEESARVAWKQSRHLDQRSLEREALRLREKVVRVWSGLRAERLRWSWRGGTAHGWTPNFDRAWGRLPRSIPLQEAIRRSGFTNEQVRDALLRADREEGVVPRLNGRRP